MSSDESASDASMAIEPLSTQAAALIAVSTRAAPMDRRVTLRVSRAVCSTGRPPAWIDLSLGVIEDADYRAAAGPA